MNVCAVGGTDGRLEFWNFNHNRSVIDLVPFKDQIFNEEISCVKFEGQGKMNFYVGTEKGKVIQYDMRYPLPIHTFTHHYRLPIK